MSPIQILRTIFGYNEFRQDQAVIIEHLLQGNNALVLMPTGGGKSLCYQIPAIARRGVGIVISPLIALMQDQVEALWQLGVRAEYLNSTLDAKNTARVEQALLQGELDLLYIAPERLLTPQFLNLLTQIEIALFAIDEAHCVSKWGHDFRPEYIKLSFLHKKFGHIPRIALTATADQPTKAEIIEHLGLQTAKHFIASFDRPNIFYSIVPKKNARLQLKQFLQDKHPKDAGIVYCLSRKRVEETAEWLQKEGFSALPYHAGLNAKIRQQAQHRFIREEGIIMVATVAFGMGIDKPNVRFVAHLDLPKSMEGYYQETGRAGRDGLPANAWLAYGLSDVVLLRQMLDQSEAAEEFKQLERRKLEALLGFCETTLCRRQVLLQYFGEVYAATPCNHCDNCLHPVATWDGKVAAQKALSCVYRTGQRFGVKHLIDVLLGKTTAQVTRFNHHKVSTFGIGTEFTQQQWQSIFRQLVAADFLMVDFKQYGSIRLTSKCQKILRGEESIALRTEMPKEKGAKKSEVVARKIPDDAFWQALKDQRLALAREQGVPPYVIFHDSSLAAIHAERPKNRAEFSKITGVGQHKLEKYAEAFIAVVAENC